MEQDRMLTFAAVGRLLGVSSHTVAKLIDAGSLESFEPSPGKPRRVWESDLAEYRARTKKMKSCENRELSEVSKADH